jgi:16S rRNA (guanine966-N2)-methyltransferase
MRIIAGAARGTPLVVPHSGVRPTSDRVREAIFSSLAERLPGASVLDLFAGSGALGLEAASRGAATVSFVERSPQVIAALEKNIVNVQKNPLLKTEFRVLRGNVFRRLHKLNQQFSLIFADPPYGVAAQLLVSDGKLPPLLEASGIFVLESAKRAPAHGMRPIIWQVARENVYGDTRVTFLTHQR